MEYKGHLKNTSEKIAVTSSLNLVYQPVRFGFEHEKLELPSQFLSKNGKLDTSRKFTYIGGGNLKYLTNNSYSDYATQLRKMHSRSHCNEQAKSQPGLSLSSNALPEFKPPTVKKEFIMKSKKNKYTLNDFRTIPQELIDVGDDESWWSDNANPRVQGLDIEPRIVKLETKATDYHQSCVALSVPEDLKPLVADSIPTNEHNMKLTSLLTMFDKAENDIDIFLDYIERVTVCKKKFDSPRVQGATFSAYSDKVDKVNEIIDVVHENVVSDNILKQLSNTGQAVKQDADLLKQILGPLHTMISVVKSAIESILGVIDSALGYLVDLLQLPLQAITWIKTSFTAWFAWSFIWEKVKLMVVDASNLQLLGLFITIMTTLRTNASWSNNFVTILLTALGYFGISFLKDELLARVQGYDSIGIPFAMFLAVGLLSVSNQKVKPDFIGAIKSFGGISQFSNKLELMIAAIYKSLPTVLLNYFEYYCPSMYQYIQLNYVDQDFKKDFNNLLSISQNAEQLYYSSHNVYQFIQLYDKLRDVYLPKYGSFDIFQQVGPIEKIDKINNELKRRGLLPGRRHCPLVVWLGGDSGVGKSTLALHLAHQFCDPSIAFDKQVYSWNPLLDYVDGYNHQPIVIINDYMQTTDNSEEQLLISLKDACDYFMNVSSIDKPEMGIKGEVRFTSKMILITSNILYLHSSNLIRDLDAFNRRRDLLISMKFKGREGFDEDNQDFRWARFELCDAKDYKAQTTSYSVGEIADIILERYRQLQDVSIKRILRINQPKYIIQSDDDYLNPFVDAVEIPESGSLKERVLNLKNKFFDYLKYYSKTTYGRALITFTLMGLGFGAYKFLFKSIPHLMSFNSGDEHTMKRMHPIVLRTLNKSQTQSSEIIGDQGLFDKISNNMFRFTTNVLVDGRSVVRSVCCVYIGSDKVLVPKHVFYRGIVSIKPGDMILINRGEILFETHFDKAKLIEHHLDYALYDVSYVMPRMKKINHLFDNWKEPISRNIETVAINLGLDGNKIVYHTFFSKIINGQQYQDGDGANALVYQGGDMLKFSSPLRYGDCGTLVLSRVAGVFRILGLHVGGTDSVQYAQMIDPDFIPSCVETRDVVGLTMCKDIYDHNYGQFLKLAVVDKNRFPYQNTETSIQRSIAYEVLQKATTQPCVLSPHDPRNPEHISMLALGTTTLGKVMNPINSLMFPELLQYMSRFHRGMFSCDYSPLTMYEAINGIDGLDRLDFQTSPGYPYTVESIRKTDFFKFNGTFWEPTNRFKREYAAFIEDSKENGLEIIWTNCVKDERRPLDKILKSRIFTISNIHLTILGRTLFGKYISKYISQRLKHGGAVGINPYSSEWNDVYDQLNRFEYVNDGDYSKYDKDLLKEIFELFFLFIKMLIPESLVYEGRTVHWWIDEILKCCLFSKTLTILDGIKLLFQTLHGNPSGWFLTVFFNDFANKVYMSYAWIKLNPSIEPKKRLDLFFLNVVIFFFGDDNIFSVSKEFKDIYNTKTISGFFITDLNITYTSGDKTDCVSYNKSIWECKFLKNSFVKHYSGRIVAGLDKNTIQEMVSWTRDGDQSMEQIFNTALRYSYFWGPSYFEQNRQKLLSYCDTIITYQELDYEFNSYSGINFEIYDNMEKKIFENKMAKLDIVKSIQQKPIMVQSKDMSNGLRDDANSQSTMRNYGVNMVNQNIDTTTKIYNKPSEMSIPEAASTLKKLLSRPLLVINQTVPAGTFGPVVDFELPNAWVAASSSVIDIANAYFLFKGKLKMQVTLQSTPYNAGALVACANYKELSSWSVSGLDILNVANSWVRPHIELDYSDNGANKILDIPWKYKREYCDFSSTAIDSICSIVINNYSPNTFAASLLIYVWLEDADVVITRLGVHPFTASERKLGVRAVVPKSLPKVSNLTQTTRLPTTLRPGYFTKKKLENSTPRVQGFTLFGDTVTNLTTNQQIGSVQGNVVPNNLSGDQFDINGKLSLSALDQPNIPLEPPNVIATREATTSNADQVVNKEKLNLYPKEQLLADFDTFGIQDDEMSIDYLKRKWSICPMNTGTNFSYGITSAPYTVLAATNVGPYGGATTWVGSKSSAIVLSLMDYISKNHLLWRGSRSKDGSIEYRFKFCTNRFQSGRIAVAYNPVANWFDMFGTLALTGLTFTADQLGACYVAYFDINGQNNEIVVRLPYVAPTPWKTIWCGSNAVTDIEQQQLDQISNSFAGVLVVLAITPMITPEGSATSINVVPFIRGAPGFQIAVPSNRNNYLGGGYLSTFKPKLTASTPKVQSQTKSKIKIDCWELLRQVIRLPKVEFELPYYLEEPKIEVKVQSDDFVFLGDDVTENDSNYGIIPTQSLRDLCKRFAPYFTSSHYLNIFRLRDPQTTLHGMVTLCRVGTFYSVPIFPDNQETHYTNSSIIVSQPTWMCNYGGLYQGYRGSIKMRIKASMQRSSNATIVEHTQRPFEDFHMLVVLNENTDNTAHAYNAGGILEVPTDVFNSPYSIFGGFLDLSRAQDLGQILFEANFSGDIVKDIEIPMHLMNKYFEIDNEVPTDINEFRPQVSIFVYKNISVAGGPATAAAAAVLPSVLNAYQDAMVNLEILTSIGDGGRFGILDEFPYVGARGSEVYFETSSRLSGKLDTAPLMPS